MKREQACVTMWVSTETPDELANLIQTRRGRNGYGAAWVSFTTTAASRFGLRCAGTYRTTDGRVFTWLAASLAQAQVWYGKRHGASLLDAKARGRLRGTMERHGVGRFRGAMQ